jgi:hypothetical protein
MAAPASTWERLRRHAVFPLLVYLVLTQVLRESYPFSHYPMYSKPTSRPLPFQYLADETGKPLAVGTRTGITPSQVGKMYGERKKKFPDEREAALEVLKDLRARSERRKGRELPPRIQLIETTIGFKPGGFSETNRVLAEHSMS